MLRFAMALPLLTCLALAPVGWADEPADAPEPAPAEGDVQAGGEDDAEVTPSPDLTPQRVLQLQLAGLRDAGADNAEQAEAGMRRVWDFAAPDNKEMTGPFERFDAMVRAEPYRPLVGHDRHTVARWEFADDDEGERVLAQAILLVTDGQGNESWFVWVLERQSDGPVADCWMSGAVMPIEPPQPDLPQPI